MPAPQHVKEAADKARRIMQDRAKPPAPESQEPAVKTDPVEPDPPKRREGYVDPEDWKSRYDLLRANRDKRFDEMDRKLQQAQSENDVLNRRIAELQPPPDKPGFRMSDEDREMMGETGSDAVEKVAQYVDSRLEENEARQQQATQSKEQKRTEGFLEELGTLFPNWKDFNKDPKFDTWLDKHDARLDTTHRELFDQSVQARNARVVARLFNQFLDERDGDQPNSLQDPSPEPEIRSTESSTDTYEEWFGAKEISDHFTEETRLRRLGKMSGPGWEKIMERRARIDDAIANQRIMRDK